MPRRASVVVKGPIYRVCNRVGRLETLPSWKSEPAEETLRQGLDALGRSAGPERRKASAEQLLERISPLPGVTVRELMSARHDSGLVHARDLVGALAARRLGVGVKAFADALGKSQKGVSL